MDEPKSNIFLGTREECLEALIQELNTRVERGRSHIDSLSTTMKFFGVIYLVVFACSVLLAGIGYRELQSFVGIGGAICLGGGFYCRKVWSGDYRADLRLQQLYKNADMRPPV